MVAPGIAADAFGVRADIHLLTHFHEDHLAGLRAQGPPIVCSRLTGRLLTALRGIPADRLRVLDPGETLRFGAARETLVSAFDANHCPGAVMFLVETPGRRAVVTGDFRLNEGVRRQAPLLSDADVLFLDATYRGTGLRFPPQEEAIAEVVSHCSRASGPVALGVYKIGKNRVLRAAHAALGDPFYVSAPQYRIYEILGDAPDRVTNDRERTGHSAYGVGYLERYFRRGEATVIIPTGWARLRRKREGFRYVPYSEHCDERELEEFLDLTRPRSVVEVR
jgi:Cft2 family RNA processing exonuclease